MVQGETNISMKAGMLFNCDCAIVLHQRAEETVCTVHNNVGNNGKDSELFFQVDFLHLKFKGWYVTYVYFENLITYFTTLMAVMMIYIDIYIMM